MVSQWEASQTAQPIEPEIGHMKSDGRLARSPLKDKIGDAIFAVLCACRHNIRKTLAHIRALWAIVFRFIRAITGCADSSLWTSCAA